MGESSSRFRIPKTFDEEKACVINSIAKSKVYKNKFYKNRCFGNRKYKKCTAAYDVEILHDVNKREDADHVSLVFQGVTFNKCNVKLVIISTNCDNV